MHTSKKPGSNPQHPHHANSLVTRALSRRTFLRCATALSAGLSLGVTPTFAAKRNKNLPTPNRSGIKNIVVVMMENRSFDHFLGWLPGAEGRQAGLSYTDETGASYQTYPLAPDYQGCAHPDPDHTYEGGRIEYNGGACDGWLRAGDNDVYAIGYYTQNDLAFLGNAAPAWTTCDNYFSSILGPTYPNRISQHASQTDRLDNSILPLSSLPTIWDRLADHSVSRRYYFSDFPFLAFWGAKYVPISRLIGEFYADAASGNLPSVSFVDPRFFSASLGTSEDDHPHGDIRNGEDFLNQVYEAVVSSPNWPNTVLVINFDEWGGFFDHVPPPLGPVPPIEAALGNDGRLGFRVPSLIISPWSPRGTVAHQVFNHASVLKMIEWRWSLRPLSIRDQAATNMAEALNFSRRNLDAPRFAVPPGPFGELCPLDAEENALAQLLFEFAAGLGFPIGG